jgi:hypothetical protein
MSQLTEKELFSTFYPKVVTKNLDWVHGIRKKPIQYPGVKNAPYPQHRCICFLKNLLRIYTLRSFFKQGQD